MKRKNDELRHIKITKDYTKYAEGSVLVEFGETKLICTASIEDKVPPFLKNTGNGWISAEYAMLPRSTKQRKQRDSVKGKVDGRSQEIQRLIGRSLRNAVDFKKMGEKTIWIDCDVIQADGGTRTTAINGAFVALALATKKLYDKKIIKYFPIKSFVCAISVGIVKGQNVLDLCYEQDSNADVDMNIVMNEKGEFIEIQGTGEQTSFSRDRLNELLDLALDAGKKIIEKQKEVLGQDIINLIESKENDKIQDTNQQEILIATCNEHKLHEIQSILNEYNIKCTCLKDYDIKDMDVEENGESFEENALIKARYYSKLSGKICIADDSGLMVDALNGRPGVHSKRFSNQEPRDLKNNEKLLRLLSGLTLDQRTAKFVSVIALVYPDSKEYVFEGQCSGKIGFNILGENGFGYDPLFIPDDKLAKSKTFAQLDFDLKNKISHRAKSIEKLKEFLSNYTTI